MRSQLVHGLGGAPRHCVVQCRAGSPRGSERAARRRQTGRRRRRWSAPSPRARRWRTGGLQVRGLRPAPWRRVHRYVRAPSRRRNEQPKSTASPTTRPRLAVDGVCVRLSARPYTESGVVHGWGRGGWRRSPQSCLTTAAQVPSTYDHPNQQGHCLRSTRLYRLGHT